MAFPRLSETEAVILELLVNRGELYGLQMIAHEPSLKRGTIYVTLGRMADKGFVESREVKEPSTPGLPRRLFKATGLGQRALAASRAAAAVMSGELGYA
ncbi:MAG: PadR family transcriptional regulator [Parvibaculaceae bacterium]